MKTHSILLASLILLTFYGCITAKVTSNKAEWYDKKLSRVYVFLNTASGSEKFSDRLSRGLMSEFGKNKIEGRYQIRDPLSLETEKDIEERVANFKPDQLMILKQTGTRTVNHIVDGGTFEISIIEEATKKVIWKGVMNVNGQFGTDLSIEVSLKKLIEKLKMDGLI